MPHVRPQTPVAVTLAAVLTAGLLSAATWAAPADEVLQQAAPPLSPVREAVRTAGQVPGSPAAAPAQAGAPAAAPAAAAVAPPAAPAPAPGPARAAAAPAPAPAPAAPAPAAPAPAAPSPAAEPAAPAPAPAPVPAAGPTPGEYEARLVAAVNGERTVRGLPPLSRDGCADRPAREQAGRMAAAGALSHQDLGAVLDACGGTRAAENVGSGDVSPERLVELWMASAGHRRNVLDPAVSSLGSGAVRAADGRWYASHVLLGG